MSPAPRTPLPRGAWPFVALVAAVSALLHVSLSRWPYDDAFIHFRIVRQWLTHGAPYFNSGEAVLATSSPGWTWVLTPLFLLPGPETQWVALVNALVVTAAVVLFCRLLTRLGGDALGWPWVVGYAVPALALLHPAGVGLMETPLALLVLVVALSLYLERRESAFFWLG
ncbi:MAG: hypothetical protein GWO02_15200, partial [Gammaproteobacteria bacterium]|nr:hypothetical protein [Gammaproteobacteria bacterium]